jgi:hypothetical protein
MENTSKGKREPIWKSFQKTEFEKLELKKAKAGLRRIPLKLVAKITL